MPHTEGQFVWYELMTTDTRGARTFYGKVAGWGSLDVSQPDLPYALFTSAGEPAAGLVELPEQACRAGARPGWIGYVATHDVDATAQRVRRRGGAVHVPPRNIPGIGRFAIVADPQGASFGLLKWDHPVPDRAPDPTARGRIGWHELAAADWRAALAFYAEFFGWQKAAAMEVEQIGTYQFFAAGGIVTGGMFDKPAEFPVPFWLYYIVVDDIIDAALRVTAHGGAILNGPMQVPGGGWMLQAQDPQGALFALYGPKTA